MVQSWAFTAITLKDAGNADRRPALKLTWSGVDDDEVEGVAYEVRLQASGAAVADGVVLTGASGQVVVSAGILPQTQYEARLRLVPSGSRRADWTAWASATTGDVRLAEGDIPASVNQAVVDFNAVAAGFEGTLVDLQVDAEAAQQAALDSDAARLASETARDAAQNARDNAQTAADAAGNSATVAAGSASSAQTSATAAGSSASVSEGQALIATTSAAEAARTAALAGPAILAAPAEQWTDGSANTYSVLLKKATPAANLVTGDADFGDAFAYPDTANQTIGQAYPFPWHDAAVYEVRARFKVVDDGTMGALDMRLGGTVQAGVAVLESNNQTGVIAATAADGVVEAVAWFTGRVAAEVSAVSGGVEVKAFTSAVGGDKFYPHLRQNANGNSNGLVRLGALEVRDITAQVDAMLAEAAALGSATAAASSATAASASETAAGTSASAAETARLQAQTAQGAAETARDAAATSQTNAQGSASAAATSATNSATSASAAGNSASAASTSASAAGTSATLAGQHATSASGHADTASIQAGNASTSASAAATSASSASGSAAAASTSASTAAGVLQEINLSATDYQRVITGTAALDAVGSDETASDGGASFGQAGTVISATGSGASFSTTGSTSGLRVEVPMEQAVGFGGGRVRVDILAKPADTNAAAGFTAAYSTSDNGNSGRNDFTLAAGWAWYSFYYDVPVPNSGGTDFVGLWGDSAATGKKTEFARVLIRQAPLAGDIPELGVVQADVTVAQAAVADLEGNALASFVMRAKAGAALGSVEIVAAKDASNGGAAASKVKLTGDEIEFDGMSVFTDDLRSNNYVEGSSGWRIRSNGNIEFNKLIARGDIVNSAVNADLLDSSAVVTDKVAENAISRFYSAFGGSSNKQIAVTNNTGVQVDLLIIAFIRGEHSAIENSTVNVRLYKETVSGGLSNEIGRMEELSTAGGLVKLTGTAIATTTQSNGITRYYRAVGTNCSQIDLVVFQRQK